MLQSGAEASLGRVRLPRELTVTVVLTHYWLGCDVLVVAGDVVWCVCV